MVTVDSFGQCSERRGANRPVQRREPYPELRTLLVLDRHYRSTQRSLFEGPAGRLRGLERGFACGEELSDKLDSLIAEMDEA